MPENTASNILTEFLNDDSAVDALSVARQSGNDLASEGFGSDLLNLSYGELTLKYGPSVANHRHRIQEGINRTSDIQNTERSTAQIVGDSALSVGSGAINTASSLLSLGLAGIGSVDNENGENNTLNELASDTLEVGGGVSNLLKSLQSDKLRDRKDLSQIQSELDKLDRETQYAKDIEADGSFIAGLKKVGNEALDTGERILSDGAVAGDVISEAVGSLGPSAKIAGAGARLATGTAAKVTSNQAVQKLASTAGAAAGVGVAEASGVYAQTVRAVEDMSHEQLTVGSDEYVDLIASGKTPEEARAKVALDTGKEAFSRQLPTATALGLLTARFEAAPIGSFRGSGLLGGFRQIGAQALEEGAQGGTGAYNQNVAIQNQADRDKDITDGIGEELATGVIAGAGMAAALAVPSVVTPAVSPTVKAARNLADAVKANTPSGAGIVDTIKAGGVVAQQKATQAREAVAPVVGPVVDRVRDVTQAVSQPIVARVQDYNAQSNKTLQNEKAASAIKARDTARTIVEEAELSNTVEQVEPAVSKLVSNTEVKPVPERFSDAVSEVGSPIENVAGILEKLQDKDVKINRLSDEEVTFAFNQFGDLAQLSKDLPTELRKDVMNTLSSPDVRKIAEQFRAIDLNEKQKPEDEITKEFVDITVQVAKNNPTNVNPEVVNKILQHSAREDITPEDIRLLEAASLIASEVNNHVGAQVEISKDYRVALSQKPAYNGREEALPDVLDPSKVARSIQVGGFTDRGGKKLRSVNDFAADIFKAAQNPEGGFKVTNDSGVEVEGTDIAQQFSNFVTHMSNKVEALNTSFDQRDSRGKGASIGFTGLVGGTKFLAPGEKGAPAPVAVHVDAPKSVRFAKQVHADAVVAANVFNTLVDTFPEIFTTGKVNVPVLRDLVNKSVSDVPGVTDNTLSDKTPNEPLEVVSDPVAQEDVIAENTPETQTEDTNEVLSEKVQQLDNPEVTLSQESDTTAVEEASEPQAVEASEQQPETQEAVQTEEDVRPIEEVSNDLLIDDTIPDYTNLNSRFVSTFRPTGLDVNYTDGHSLIDKISEAGKSGEFVKFARVMMKPLINGMQNRLKNTQLKGSLVKEFDGPISIQDAIVQGADLAKFAEYKNTVITDQNTGLYDERLISLASLAVIDWLTAVRMADPHQLNERLEDLNLTFTDISSEDLNNIAWGLSPRQVAEGIAKDIERLWNVQSNLDAPLADIRGITEGLVKEMITFLDAKTELIQITDIPIKDDKGELRIAQTINVQGMVDLQKKMGFDNQGAVQQFLAPELNNRPSIGEKIKSTDQTQSRGKTSLSNIEKAAITRMQDTPHFVSEGMSALVEAIGFDNMFLMLGGTDLTEFTGNDVLLRSIEGKNLSIERDFVDAISVLEEVRRVGQDDVATTPIHYPVSVSKVGRHQFKGINPQNNKILRTMITPTHSTLDMTTQTDQDAFWLTVAQAADLFKVENENHEQILANVQDAFAAEFDPAVETIEAWLRGEDLNGPALLKTMGNDKGAAELSAVLAVAQLNFAKSNGTESSFQTSLSFELDGKTDGPGNMMNNFGRGVLTDQDFSNMNRVGHFIGRVDTSLNDYFSKGNVDLYEVTSRKAEKEMVNRIVQGSAAEKASFAAIQNFAAKFGDFRLNAKTGQISMTRNTSKNPMTKTVYGSGVKGVGSGIAQDMLIEFYRGLSQAPAGTNLEEFFGYPGMNEDLKSLFGQSIDGDPTQFSFSPAAVAKFDDMISKNLGDILLKTSKNTVGDRITEVNDLLIFLTNVQSDYLSKLFDEKLAALVESKKAAGLIKSVKDLSQRDYNAVVKEVSAYAPIYSNGVQTLAVGSFSNQASAVELSSSMDGRLRQTSSLQRPDNIGVKVIPYLSIGRGDAMMMNTIYSADNAPTDTLPVFDGIDMPVSKVQRYAGHINEAVLNNWNRDILGDVVSDFQNFMQKVGKDDPALQSVFADVVSRTKDTSVTAGDAQSLLETLQEYSLENQARKNVFRTLPVSVDHMGGSGSPFSRGEANAEPMTVSEINQLIQKELVRLKGRDATPQEKAETKKQAREEFKEISFSTGKATISALIKSSNSQLLRKSMKAIESQIPADVHVITGSLDQLNEYRQQNFPDDGQVLTAAGQYDVQNNVIFVSRDSNESIAHELIHAATFSKVLAHYEGQIKDPAVKRLEDLMEEFMELGNYGNPSVNAAITAILGFQAKNDNYSKAAALNEFMSWSLSNAEVAKVTSGVKSTQFSKLSKKVIALMKRIMGNVSSDIFSGVLFNTQVLGGVPPIDFTDDGEGGNGNGGNDSGDGEVTPPAKQHTNFWIDLMRERIAAIQTSPGQKTKRTEQYTRYVEASDNAVDKLEIGGFNFNEEQRQTFKAIHSVMAMETRLNTQSAAVLNKLYTYITDNLTPEMFGPMNADARFSAVMDLFGATKNDNDVSDAIAVLLALSQTSKGFRRALDRLPIPEAQNTEVSSLNEALTQATGFLMRKAVGTINTEDASAKESLDALSESILNQDTEKEFSVLRRLMGGLNQSDEFVSGGINKLSEGMFDLSARVDSDIYPRIVQAVVKSAAIVSSFLNLDRAELTQRAGKDILHMGQSLDNFVPVREFVTEVVGSDSINADTMALLDRTNHAVSSVRQAYREDLPVFLQNAFENHPDAEQWTQLHTVIGKSDFGNLFDLTKPDVSINLVKSPAKLSNAISDSESVIQKNMDQDVADFVIQKAQQLGSFMVGGEPGLQLMKNAYAINKLAGAPNEAMVAETDRLASLYALQSTEKTDREAIVEMYENDQEGVTNLIVYIQGLNKEEDMKIISEVAKMNGYKGYVPDHAGKNTRVVIEEDSKQEDLSKAGFVRVGDYTAQDEYSSVKRGYYVTTVKQGGMFSQGVMQQVHDSYRGVDSTTGLTITGNTSGVISGEEIDAINQQLNKGNVTILEDVLLPVYDETLGVSHYERAISPNMQRAYFNRRSNLALMLGSWAGRQVEEKFAKQYNLELVDQLKDIHSNRDTGLDGLYVNIADSKLDDPVFKDAWNVIPADTKEYIASVFGEDSFPIRKDMVNLALGYREASVLDLWTGKTRLPTAVQKGSQAAAKLLMGDLAMSLLSRGEETTQSIVSNVKDLIVIRSLVVPYMNSQANFVQLSTRGVPLKKIISGYRDKLSEIETYNNNVSRVIELETLIRLNANDQNRVKILEGQIQTIQDENNRMSIAAVVQAGAYKNISEGITDLDVELSSGRFGEWLENQVNKLPGGVQTVAKYGLLSKDTALYKGANKAVQYGDFLAKSIMFDHLVEQKGLSRDEAITEVNEEFVNFSFLPGRTRSYLESLGATWFMSFKIRIMKIAMKILRENPVRAMITAGTVGDLGSPVEDNLASVVAQDRLDYALGWDMLWGSPQLNPWVQATDLVSE